MTTNMRRNNQGYQPLPQAGLEEQNDVMTERLQDRIQTLKSLSIDIGNEVREQNKFLDDMDEDFDRTGGFMSRTMNRVVRLGKGGHNRHILYLMLFSFLVFIIIWILVR